MSASSHSLHSEISALTHSEAQHYKQTDIETSGDIGLSERREGDEMWCGSFWQSLPLKHPCHKWTLTLFPLFLSLVSPVCLATLPFFIESRGAYLLSLYHYISAKIHSLNCRSHTQFDTYSRLDAFDLRETGSHFLSLNIRSAICLIDAQLIFQAQQE